LQWLSPSWSFTSSRPQAVTTVLDSYLSHGDQPCFARKRLNQPCAFFGAIGPALRFLLGQRQEFSVRRQIRHAELGDSGLARSGHLARSAQLEVDFSETESIGA